MPAPVVVAEIVRSGFVEGHHYGSIVVLDRDGEVDWSVGDVTSAMFPRSCNKPVQALAMLRAGLDLPPDLLEQPLRRVQLRAVLNQTLRTPRTG